MNKKKAFWGVSLGLFLGSMIFALSAKADGMLVAPPGVDVYETDQKAVIFFEEGTEDLFISVSFQGNAEEFGWIVPTPSEPEVVKSTDLVFTTLDELTRPEYPAPTRGNWNNKMMLEGAMDSGVQVLQTKKIEYYDISVLKADNKDALYNWFNDNGYSFPQAGKYIIDEYIEKNWAFTAIKIDNDRLNSYGINRQLSSGHAVPLRMTFKTDRPVFPLKISSVNGMEDNAPKGEIAFVTGAEGKGMLLDSNKVVATDRVIQDFDVDNGSINFNLKKRKDAAIGEILRVEQAKSYLGSRQGIVVENPTNNVYKFELWRNKGQHQSVQVDLGSDYRRNEWQNFEFSWKEDEADPRKAEIKFLIDGVERTLNTKGYGMISLRANEINNEAKLTIGGREQYTYNGEISSYQAQRSRTSEEIGYIPPEPSFKYNTFRSVDILLDEVQLNSNQKTVFKASFDDSMNVSLVDGKEDVVRVFESKSNSRRRVSTRPDSMGVLIYLFSDKKYEIPGFDLQYAGRIDKEEIESIAKIDDGRTPWISPKKDKYFLTRMYKHMDISQMTEDIYPQESKNQDQFNAVGGDNNRMIFLVILLVISFGSVGFMVLKVVMSERKNSQKSAPKKPSKARKIIANK